MATVTKKLNFNFIVHFNFNLFVFNRCFKNHSTHITEWPSRTFPVMSRFSPMQASCRFTHSFHVFLNTSVHVYGMSRAPTPATRMFYVVSKCYLNIFLTSVFLTFLYILQNDCHIHSWKYWDSFLHVCFKSVAVLQTSLTLTFEDFSTRITELTSHALTKIKVF